MNRYGLFVLIPILVGFGFSLQASTLSVRKKNLESRIRTVMEIDTAIGVLGEGSESSPSRVEQIAAKADEILQNPSGKEKVRLLGLLEEDLHRLMLEYSERMDSFSGELLDEFSHRYFLKEDWKGIRDLGKKEKILRYYEMAKKEREQGKSYQRMNHFRLALLSFKRSILYSFRSFHLTQTELPTSYHRAYERWMKDTPPGSETNLNTGESEMEKDED